MVERFASMTAHVLPDVLAHDLDFVFCGTAAGTASARRNAYYAGPGNAFWATLFRVGLTPSALRPEDFRRLIDWNMGLTDLAKTVCGRDTILRSSHFDSDRLRTLIKKYRPKIFAFTSKRAAEEFLGHRVVYGLVAQPLEQTRFYVLPSPSGAARRFWDEQYWHDLAGLRGRATRRWTRLANHG